jgi:cytoskeletal protein RodZ
VRALEAIERGDFRKLPGGIYNTSYIRQYARAIDYEESILLEFYHRHMNADAVPVAVASSKTELRNFRPASGIVGS